MTSERARCLAVGLVVAVLAVACTGEGDEAGSSVARDVSTTARTMADMAPEGEVDAVLYFRSAASDGVLLERVTRRMALTDGLAEAVVTALLAGPTEDEDGVVSTWPSLTRVVRVSVTGGTAHVVLTRDAVDERAEVGGAPDDEALALASLANTLTELPDIDAVDLRIAGMDPDDNRAFWGGWGLPAPLVRDESLIGTPVDGEGLLVLEQFSSSEQTIGGAATTTIAAVRIRDRITHQRLVVELDDPEGSGSARIPQARARRSGDDIVLTIRGVTDVADDVELDADLKGRDAAGARLERGDLEHSVRVIVPGDTARDFHLHTLTGPPRIVLDVRK